MTVYRSKISYGLLSFVTIGLTIAWLLPALYDAPTNAMIIIALVMIATKIFIIHALYTTYYWIDENEHLCIKAGFMTNLRIPIAKITKIQKTSSWLASPAASFDRIEVFYGQWNTVVISPREQKELVATLQTINPKIEVKV